MRVLLLILLLVLPVRVWAQPHAITQLGIEQGLSNNYIVSITQDKDGFLWFATEEGLNKFDGAGFVSYYKHTGSISGNELNCVYADRSDPVIWIATQRAGLNAYNYEQDTLEVFTHREEAHASLITNDVTDIAQAADGNLWISTFHWGIDFFDKAARTFTHYNTTTLPDLPSNNVWTIMDGNDGRLYVGHVSHGLTILSVKDKQIQNFRNDPSDPESLPGNTVRCIYTDQDQNIWIGTNRGLALFNRETGKFLRLSHQPDDLLSSYIFDIRQTDDKKLWLATELNGVVVIDLKQRFFIQPGRLDMEQHTIGHNKFSLSSPSVRCVFQDSFGNIWLGTYGGGINFIGRSQPLFNAYSYSPVPDDINSLNNRVALSVCLDKDERLWIGTDGSGINVFEKEKRVAVYRKENGSLSHNIIQAAFRDSDNNIWLGTFQGGVLFYDAARKQFQPVVLDGRSNQDVRCFFEDAGKQILIGTSRGIFVIDPETKREIQYYNVWNSPLPENTVRCIAQDSRGRLWVGTFGRGLGVYTPGMQPLGEFNVQEGFCSNTINHLFRDSHGQMWVATGEGLACFADADSLHYQVFRRNDGLNNTYIRAITEDRAGNLWFSSNAGISCRLAAEKQFRHYNYFDKTPMGSFSNAAVSQDNNGTIFFGSINGVRFFNPASVLSARDVPPVVITGMNVYEPQTAQKNGSNIHFFGEKNRNITLDYKQNTFGITFNIQDYSLANQVEYAYRMKGMGDSWITMEENSVLFRNVPPGRYEFQVRTRIRNQAWPDAVRSLHIRITPPLWLTWWAKTFYFLTALLIVYALLYAYTKRISLQSSYELEKKNHEQEQELNQERLRFYTNIAHELRTPLTLIIGPLEDMQKDAQLPLKQLQKISVIRQSAHRLLNLINQIMEFRKTETQNKKLCVSKGNIAALVRETGLKYKELNRNPDVRFLIHAGSDPVTLYYDREVVQIILDNLISNAIKYTGKGSITLTLSSAVREGRTYTEISVADTGSGIPPEEQTRIFNRYYQAKDGRQTFGTGIGLALVKNLVILHEGEIRVDSRLNSGSTFCFSLLTDNTYPAALHSEPERAKEEEATETVGQTEAEEADAKPILLVVEDNDDIREYIAGSLSGSFDILTAKEGGEGCKAAFAHIPDLIVTDVMMPGMDGITFCKAMKEDVRTSHIPVILLTAKDTLQDKEEGYRSGADSYLTKPFSASLLHSRINNLLDVRKKLARQFSSNLHMNGKGMLFKESRNRLDNEFLDNMTRLIEENLESEKVDIAYLSHKLYISSSTLYRKVKALTGISTNEFVRKIKMRNAEQLLLTGKYNITEAAFRVGISSPVYFRQCFKEEFGASPSDYLKRIKET